MASTSEQEMEDTCIFPRNLNSWRQVPGVARSLFAKNAAEQLDNLIDGIACIGGFVMVEEVLLNVCPYNEMWSIGNSRVLPSQSCNTC